MSDAAVRDTAIQRFRRSRRMARYLSHAVLLEGGISVFVRSAMVMLSVGFLALIAWSATTEIKETAITFGQVMPTSAVNKIQHLEGGIIEEIMVRDGDLVEKGQVLLRLKADGAQAELSQTETRLGNLQLEAERFRALAEGANRTSQFFMNATLNWRKIRRKSIAFRPNLMRTRTKSFRFRSRNAMPSWLN